LKEHLIKRLIVSIPTIIGITIVAFLLMYVLPGDPVDILMAERLDPDTEAMLREEMGLDDPLHQQYLTFITNALQGDFGRSYHTRQPVGEMLGRALPATIQVSVWAYLLSIAIGIPLGTYAAVRHKSWADTGTMFLALLGICAPPFVVALFFLYMLGYQVQIFPLGGYGTWMHMVLPAITLGVRPAGMLARITRSGMLEVLREDYVRTARSKGLGEKIVIWRHALRNTMIPVITVMGTQISGLLSGSVVVEAVFAWPGIGHMSVEAIQARDFPVVQGVVLVSAIIVVVINLLVDLSYGAIDPRVRYD